MTDNLYTLYVFGKIEYFNEALCKKAKAQQRKENIAQKRMAIQKASEEKRNRSVKRPEKSGTAQTHERANIEVSKKPE